ncbi:DELLA protein RGL3-like [Coffea eugenioides]|uniref:DELLA protein RGL3-like n=1 Tax=Coffea eugenioides TaxID=49369 RepID=UPI000F61495C|nr:DELLA protein RGL3-like [Coffea eugenioides]
MWYKVERLRDPQKLLEENPDTPNNSCCSQALLTDKIMKLPKAQLVQLNSKKADVLSSGKVALEANAVYLPKLLKTLNLHCCIVYYFAKALNEKIDQALGIISSDKLKGQEWLPMAEELDKNFLEPVIMSCQQEVPFCLETQFISSQSILEAVTAAKKVRLMDFEIDNGSQWTLIMEALAVHHECPVELLKITDVGTCEATMEKMGKRLSSSAQTINLPFSFKIVVSDLKDLKEEFFNSEADEAVAIDLAYRLW